MEFSIKDKLRQFVEIQTGGSNTIMYDEYGNPNIMVCVNKYDASILGLKAGTMPAFVVDANGKEVNEIWVSKYINSVGNDGCPISWHGRKPWGNLSVEEIRNACRKKGKGWHMMTNLEWVAVALLSWRSGHCKRMPNAHYGLPGISNDIETNPNSDGENLRDVTGFFVSEQSTDETIAGIINLGDLRREFVDGVYAGGENAFEDVWFWGIPVDDYYIPINAYNGGVEYVNGGLAYDIATVDGSPDICYNNDHIRDNGSGVYRTHFYKVRTYTPHIPAGSREEDTLRKLGLLPLAEMNETNSCGTVTLGRITDTDEHYILRGSDTWAGPITQGIQEFASPFCYGFADMERRYQWSFRSTYISEM